jgi:hypothetical protein
MGRNPEERGKIEKSNQEEMVEAEVESRWRKEEQRK